MRYSLAILIGLQRKSHVYMGTVTAGERRNRRKRNRVARKARRVTRARR